MPTQPKHRKWIIIAIAAMVMNTVLATAVIAGHRFNDVPNTNIFHEDITWLADNDITRGCDPPTNNLFCPKNNVTREQMAAFMHRFAGAFGAAGDSNDPFTIVAIPTAAPAAEVLSVDVSPKSDAVVVLNANVTLTKSGTASGVYTMVIRRGSCSGEQVGHGAVWTTSGLDLERTTLSITELDTVSTSTTYKVCVLGSGGASVTATRSAITAHWAPMQ